MVKWKRDFKGLYTATIGGLDWMLTHDPKATTGYQWSASCDIEGTAPVYSRTKQGVTNELTRWAKEKEAKEKVDPVLYDCRTGDVIRVKCLTGEVRTLQVINTYPDFVEVVEFHTQKMRTTIPYDRLRALGAVYLLKRTPPPSPREQEALISDLAQTFLV